MTSPFVIQGAIQRTQDITQLKMNEDNKPQFDHVTINAQQKKEEIQKHEQINKKDNANQNDKKYDAKEKGSNSYSSLYNQKKKRENEEGSVEKKNKGSFDVFV